MIMDKYDFPGFREKRPGLQYKIPDSPSVIITTGNSPGRCRYNIVRCVERHMRSIKINPVKFHRQVVQGIKKKSCRHNNKPVFIKAKSRSTIVHIGNSQRIQVGYINRRPGIIGFQSRPSASGSYLKNCFPGKIRTLRPYDVM